MVYENNIDENVSFNTPHFNIKKIIAEPNSALYDVKDYILYSPQFQKYHFATSLSTWQPAILDAMMDFR